MCQRVDAALAKDFARLGNAVEFGTELEPAQPGKPTLRNVADGGTVDILGRYGLNHHGLILPDGVKNHEGHGLHLLGDEIFLEKDVAMPAGVAYATDGAVAGGLWLDGFLAELGACLVEVLDAVWVYEYVSFLLCHSH